MIRDESVFIMGEEVARYNGAYKVSFHYQSLDQRCGYGDGQTRRAEDLVVTGTCNTGGICAVSEVSELMR